MPGDATLIAVSVEALDHGAGRIESVDGRSVIDPRELFGPSPDVDLTPLPPIGTTTGH